MRDAKEIYNKLVTASNDASANNEILIQIHYDMERRLIFLSNTTSVPPLMDALSNLFVETFKGNSYFGLTAECFVKACMFAVDYARDSHLVELEKFQRYQEFKKGNTNGISDSELDEFLDRVLEERNKGELPILYVEYCINKILLRSLIKPVVMEFGMIVDCDNFQLYKEGNLWVGQFPNLTEINNQIMNHILLQNNKYFKLNENGTGK